MSDAQLQKKHSYMHKDEDNLRREHLQVQNLKKARNMEQEKPRALTHGTNSGYKSRHGLLTPSERYRVNIGKQNLRHEVQPDEPMKVTIIKQLRQQLGKIAADQPEPSGKTQN
jgi:hypothetical protein